MLSFRLSVVVATTLWWTLFRSSQGFTIGSTGREPLRPTKIPFTTNVHAATALPLAITKEAFSTEDSSTSSAKPLSPLSLLSSTTSTKYSAVQLNEFFKQAVPKPIKNGIAIFIESDQTQPLEGDIVTLLTAAPGSPGVPRPLWLVIPASLSTGLLWYGFYKFAIEEELYHLELLAHKEPRGFGGYGTLGPFTYGLLLGPLCAVLHVPGGLAWSIGSIVWIYYTQILLYDRVNEMYRDEGVEEEPLNIWWCIPFLFPFNWIVGLRQVHFLSQYFYRQRGIDPIPIDPVSDFFPFIKAPRFTWQDFLLTPSLWCSLLADQEPIDVISLPQPISEFLKLGTTSKDNETKE
jgi:hypothetical protein